MDTWNLEQLKKIAETDDLHISPLREDGTTYGTPTWIWSVAVDGTLYARAYNGEASSWYKAAVRQKAGRITAAGETVNVTFVPANAELRSRIDDAYRSKYGTNPYLPSMIGDTACAATIEIHPS